MRRTLPAKDLPGKASSVMRTGWPTAIFGASTSSIGAFTYRQRLVDQVDRRRHRHARRRRRRVLADLADDLGHRAVEGRHQHRALARRADHLDAGLRLRHVGLGGGTGGHARIGLRAQVVQIALRR